MVGRHKNIIALRSQQTDTTTHPIVVMIAHKRFQMIPFQLLLNFFKILAYFIRRLFPTIIAAQCGRLVAQLFPLAIPITEFAQKCVWVCVFSYCLYRLYFVVSFPFRKHFMGIKKLSLLLSNEHVCVCVSRSFRLFPRWEDNFFHFTSIGLVFYYCQRIEFKE